MTDNEMIFETAKIVEPDQKWEIFEDIYINAPQPYKQCVGYRYPAHSGWILARDYLNDLNAMHEAEETIPENLDAAYACNLAHLVECCGWLPETGNSIARLIHATARQRDESFLRTFGKWKESPSVCQKS